MLSNNSTSSDSSIDIVRKFISENCHKDTSQKFDLENGYIKLEDVRKAKLSEFLETKEYFKAIQYAARFKLDLPQELKETIISWFTNTPIEIIMRESSLLNLQDITNKGAHCIDEDVLSYFKANLPAYVSILEVIKIYHDRGQTYLDLSALREDIKKLKIDNINRIYTTYLIEVIVKAYCAQIMVLDKVPRYEKSNKKMLEILKTIVGRADYLALLDKELIVVANYTIEKYF